MVDTIDGWIVKERKEELIKDWENAKILISELTFEEFLIAKIVHVERKYEKVRSIRG